MPNPLSHYETKTADWRTILRQNNTRTFFVIFLFCLIYGSVGLIIDMYLASMVNEGASLTQLFMGFATFKIFPLVTLLMLGIASISLLVTYTLYDKLMLLGTDYKEITKETAKTPSEVQLYNVIEEMKIAAALRFMPKVFIIDADYMNAFASGYSEKSAMVAITRGLMEKLNRRELQAVMAHELSHIKHLDIKLTLTASLLANLTIIVLDLFLFKFIKFSSSGRNNKVKNTLALAIIILRYTLPLFSIILLLYLSRKRELMADAGCVALMRENEPLASALLKIQEDHLKYRDKYAAAYDTAHEHLRREVYIFDPSLSGIGEMATISSLFSTHPSLEERLAALGFKQKDL